MILFEDGQFTFIKDTNGIGPFYGCGCGDGLIDGNGYRITVGSQGYGFGSGDGSYGSVDGNGWGALLPHGDGSGRGT